jgi:hypothetical protein
MTPISPPIWLVFVGTVLVALLAVELGYRRGRFRQHRASRADDQEKEAPVGAMVGTTLGLLGFLLAFTFGIAADTFHERKLAQLHEANGIESVFLQSRLVPEPHGSEIRGLLRQYVDARLRWTGDLPGGPGLLAEPLLREVWTLAIDYARADRSDVSAAFLEAVDDLGHAGAERVLLREHSHIPGAYWAALGMIAVLAFAAMGYHGGVAGTTRSPVMAAVAVTFSLVIALIVDIDRPGEGWVNVQQDAMFEVRELMQRTRD